MYSIFSRNLSKSRNTTNKRHGIYCPQLKGCRMKIGNWLLHWPLPMKETVPFLRTVSFLPFFVASYSLAFSFFSTICFIHHYSAPATTSSESYFEVELVNRLQSVVEKQRGQIKKLEQSNIEFKSDNEEVRIIYT